MTSMEQIFYDFTSRVIDQNIGKCDKENPDEWVMKSVRIMMKVLKKYDALDLVYDVIVNGAHLAKCQVIHNEKLGQGFGRIQLLILKLFRFPNIRFNTQIKSTSICRSPFSRRDKDNRICVNPNHYKLVDVPNRDIPPVVVNKANDFGELPHDDQRLTDIALLKLSQAHARKQEETHHSKEIPNVILAGDEIKLLYDSIADQEDAANGVVPFTRTPTSPPLIYRGPTLNGEEVYYQSGLSSPASVCGMPSYFPNDIEMTDESGRNRTEMRPEYNNGMGKLAFVSNGQFECVDFHEAENWMSLTYYEESHAVSSPIDITVSNFLIDGYTSSSLTSDRFCIGFFSNINRSNSSTEIRTLVGRGLRLNYFGGDVYLESLTHTPIFVQSLIANLSHGFHINTVSKIPPGCAMKIFSNTQFAKHLAEAAEKSYQDVYALTKLCTIRVSFVKGWGIFYKRSSILHAPCWFQAQVNGPLKWIDKVLECMGAPPFTASSRT